jgi:hypothetical protein
MKGIDFIEDMSDVVVNRKISIEGLLNKVRHILVTLEASKGRPVPHSTSHQLEGTSRNLMARRGHADDA